MKATIYHNPRCSKSRQALQLLEEHNCEVHVVLYLQNPLDAQTIDTLANITEGGIRALLRDKEPEYKQWQLADTGKSDAELIDALVKQPKLLNRPVVQIHHKTADKAIVARPPELLLSLLD